MLTKTALLERLSQNSRNLAIQEFKTAAMLQQFVPYETLICCWPFGIPVDGVARLNGTRVVTFQRSVADLFHLAVFA
jgi:hypothetical protein